MKTPLSYATRLTLAAFLFVLPLARAASQPLAQNGTAPAAPPAQAATPTTSPAPAAPATQSAQAPATAQDNPPQPAIDRSKRTVAQNTEEAWSMLKVALGDKKPDVRVAAVTAIGTIQNSRVAHDLIGKALDDGDLDVRASAILAVGTTKDKGLEGQIRGLLDSKEPQLAFTSAVTLWKLNDKSGEDILMSVIAGDRKTDAGLIKGSERSANKQLHDPKKLAEIGARQGASMLLGPFGIGLTAWDYTHRHAPGENPRVTAVNLLAEEKTDNAKNTLLAALDDKDADVRAAAARALGEYHDQVTAVSLLPTFGDGKLPVRVLGAAAYIKVTSGTSVRKRSSK